MEGINCRTSQVGIILISRKAERDREDGLVYIVTQTCRFSGRDSLLLRVQPEQVKDWVTSEVSRRGSRCMKGRRDRIRPSLRSLG